MHCLPGHCSPHPHIPSLPPLNVSSVPAGCRQLLETLVHRPAPTASLTGSSRGCQLPPLPCTEARMDLPGLC